MNKDYIVLSIQGQRLSTISEEKLQEIAQLLSGSKITDAAISQAQELMK